MFLCHSCENIFRVSPDEGLSYRDIKCTQCGSTQIKQLSSWEPIGSELSQIPTEWQYRCQQCEAEFKLPIPSSPLEERSIKCPDCGGMHIHRLTRTGYEPLYCG